MLKITRHVRPLEAASSSSQRLWGSSVRISNGNSVLIDGRLPEGEICWGFLRLDEKSGRFDIDQNMVHGHVEELRMQSQSNPKSVIDYIQTWNSYVVNFFSSNFRKASNRFGREYVDKMLTTHRHIQESIFPNGSIIQHIKKMIEERSSVKDIPDGSFFFPVELGGLDLKSPFVDLLQIRNSVKKNPYDLLDEYEHKERNDYDNARRAFDKGSTRHNAANANWKPEEPNEFSSFEGYVKFREESCSVGKANLLSTYRELLMRPVQEYPSESRLVSQALGQLSGQRNLRGILPNWHTMDPYWMWIAQMYGQDIIGTFGSLNVVDLGLLPLGMVSMFRQS
ncbi:hypothetical protein TW65_01522 [Stemphylium lycopersici]|uniref:Uncharacterized protein n=1 Tax=Stemphylium lycopersici TaxID=183478 RepID=A0A364MST7_STELY|nr:hypothetical protein TW65_01522 [Stemphylium lycopersici]RAR02394.1 hypothetical protein DDE83_008584 [Stemphylium lycopersici]